MVRMVQKARSTHNPESQLFFKQIFFVMSSRANGKPFFIIRCKKAWQTRYVENLLEIGWVEAKKMTVLYRSVMFLAFCQYLYSNLISIYLARHLAHAAQNSMKSRVNRNVA